MKAIFIAAGQGSRMNELTLNIPKPLIEVNGRSILERQISLLKKFNIDEIVIITGPHPEKYKFENILYIDDKYFQNHDQLGSLAAGISEINDDVLIIFADIIFDELILEQILKNHSDITIAVDMDWSKYNIRNDNPIDDADKVSISDETVKRIFKHKVNDDDKYSIGEFIGLMKLNHNGAQIFREIFLDLEKTHHGEFHDAESFTQAKLVDFLQEIIQHNIKIHPELVNGKWCEIDTPQDLEIAKKLFID